MPAISIVIPTYNSAAYISATLGSIFEQEFEDYEVIVVDDQSSDGTADLIQSIEDPRLRYVRLDVRHGGPSRPRNVGIEMSKAPYVSMLDSDDLMSPGRLAAEVELLRLNPSIGMVFTDAEKFDDDSGCSLGVFLDNYAYFKALQKLETSIEGAYRIPSTEAFAGLLFENFVLSGGVVVPRDVFEDVGRFDESLKNADDWDMWLRISRKYDIGYLNKIGFRYRVRNGSVSRRGGSLALNKIKVVRKHIQAGLPPELLEQANHLLSVYCFDAGYGYQTIGQFGEARQYYMESARHEWNFYALRGVVIALFGPKLVRLVRRMMKRDE